MARKTLDVVKLGTVGYAQACGLQRFLVEQRRLGQISNTLLSLQHPPTYTVGKRGSLNSLLVSPSAVADLGAELHFSERGGDITFHGPQQAVLYPIIALNELGLGARRYVEKLEDSMVDVATFYNVHAHGRRVGQTGVWVEDRKLGAIGVRISSGNITSHGLAFNIDPDMKFFSRIVPCGIQDIQVTSLAKESPYELPREEVITEKLIDCFVERFGFETCHKRESIASITRTTL